MTRRPTSCDIGGQKPPQLGLWWSVAIARPLHGVSPSCLWEVSERVGHRPSRAETPGPVFPVFPSAAGTSRPSVPASRASAGTETNPEKMEWIHTFFLETPVSSPQGYVEDALSSASHGGVSDSRTARLSRKIRCGIRNREPNFFGAFGTKSAL